MIAFRPLLPIAVVALVGLSLLGLSRDEPGPERDAAERIEETSFEAVHVYLDSGRTPLASFQFELSTEAGRVRVVGVEGGEAEAFTEPPFYDRRAVRRGEAERVIVASYTTAAADALPTGRTRVATVHVQKLPGEAVSYAAALQAASDASGQRIHPILTFEAEGAADVATSTNRD